MTLDITNSTFTNNMIISPATVDQGSIIHVKGANTIKIQNSYFTKDNSTLTQSNMKYCQLIYSSFSNLNFKMSNSYVSFRPYYDPT